MGVGGGEIGYMRGSGQDVSVGISVGVGVSQCMCVRGEKIFGCSVGMLAVSL